MAPVETAEKLPQPVIRPASPADCDTVRRIAQAAYRKYLPRMDREPAPMLEKYEDRANEGTLYVLEAKERIVGFVVLVMAGNAMLLGNLAVSPDAQGQGCGRTLVEYAESRAVAAGATELRLYTNEVMHENLALYAHLGFIETHRAEDQGYRRVFMSKKLSGRQGGTYGKTYGRRLRVSE
jgi:ribosomal protein S18 acetylase RimI-like enzyme